jgi:alanyl-tRNA synthetase
MKQDMDELRQENKSIKDQLITYRIATLSDSAENHNGTRIIYSVINDLDLRSVKRISATLVSEPATITLFACVENDVKLVFARSKDLTCSMKELIVEPLAILEGRGGGSSISAQGGGPRVDQAQLALTKAVEALKSLLI